MAAWLVMPSPGSADCVAPHLLVADDSVEAGQRFDVEGSAFTSGCDDTPSVCAGPEPEQPLDDITVQMRADGRVLDEYVVSADEGGGFNIDFRAPQRSPDGQLTVTARWIGNGREETAQVQVPVGDSDEGAVGDRSHRTRGSR